MTSKDLFTFLEEKVRLYESPDFIPNDPISIPHRFSTQADIEIAGFFAALFSWGQRTTIIQKSMDLMERMDWAPHDFMVYHEEKDLRRFLTSHRTFQPDDVLFLIFYLKKHYQSYDSLEQAFLEDGKFHSLEHSLRRFQETMFRLPEALPRTKKHVSSPQNNSSCKRLCMYLRWMVRSSKQGVDFGLWKNIPTEALICPLDIHVSRVAHQLGLLPDTKSHWKAALQLTEGLKTLDAKDPVKYDFALFNLGIEEGWK